MSLFYKLAYALGITPWEDAAVHQKEFLRGLFDREERERGAPYGRVLDLGCGAGLQTVILAKRGWRSTGIDNVPKALRTARKRAQESGVDVQFVQGDVTALQQAGIGDGFDFFLDLGCFHGLNDEERQRMGRSIDAVAAPAATILLLAWTPGSRGPLPRGASRGQIEAAFPGWKVLDVDMPDPAALPKPLRNAEPRCYRLGKGR